jgi:multiple antibiotic resistance protein
MTLISAALLLFIVMDPLGNVPFFLSALRDVPEARQRTVVVRELLIALGVMTVFLFAGRFLLDVLHISGPALSIGGGVILFLIALRMVFPHPDRPLEERIHQEPLIVPLAIPYVAGPSALATLILITSQDPTRWPEWLAALLLAWSASSVIIYFSGGLRRYLGERGLTAMERLMGMVLVTVSVQMLLTGLKTFLETSP